MEAGSGGDDLSILVLSAADLHQAINYVSGVRGDLGAIQNRLDHTANNLSVMAENIQDAESRRALLLLDGQIVLFAKGDVPPAGAAVETAAIHQAVELVIIRGTQVVLAEDCPEIFWHGLPPFLRKRERAVLRDGKCGLQMEKGAKVLPLVCRTFPRTETPMPSGYPRRRHPFPRQPGA